MRLNAVKILKISVTNNSKNEILEEIQKYLSQHRQKPGKSLKIFTPNTEQLVYASKNSRFTTVLNRADIAIPDTIGIVWAGHILTKNGPENALPGVEFMEDLVALAANRHVPIGLIGGRDNLAIDTLNCLQKKYPGLTGWGIDGPEIGLQNSGINVENENENIYFSRLGRRIIREGTGIVFIALGPPKQEFFIERLTKETPDGVILMAVGGSFDIISGRLPRAPVYFRTLGLEWFWRLLLEPRRIFRQLALIEFVWMVVKEKLFR